MHIVNILIYNEFNFSSEDGKFIYYKYSSAM